jgi:hypothetical protein
MRIARLFAVLVLSLTLGVSQAAASQAPKGNAKREDRPVTARALDRLLSFVSVFWQKEGCHIDPLGGRCAVAKPRTDEGCTIDPLGRCTPSAPSADAGCGIDPWGCPKP